MSTFAYVAMSARGDRMSGTLAADSRAAAIAEMGRKGLLPVSINEVGAGAKAPPLAKAALAKAVPPKPAAKAASNGSAAAPATISYTSSPAETPVVGRVSHKAVESFTRELSNLLAGGVPLSRAMALLRREASNKNARALWIAIHEDVIGGTALADALAKFPRSFSSVYVAMVRAGEAGGFLDVVLGQIADFRTREQDLKGKVKAAMIYPCILGLLAVGVMIFMLTFFIPRFSGIFAQFGSDLPLLTQFIIGVSHLVSHYGPFVAAGVIAIVFIIRRALATEAGRRRMEIAILGTPLLGQVVAHLALVRFSRMLGTLVGAGVPLIASLRVAREAIGNQTLADVVSSSIEQVQRGTALSKSLEGNPKLFPPSVVEMIAVAEETSRLDKELLRMSTAYEADLDRQLRMLVAVAEPVMLFMMAGIIGTIVVGMLLPVFNLQDLIK